MNEQTLAAIRSIVFSAKRCGAPQTAFNIISRHLGREVNVESWRQMSQEEGDQVLPVLERTFPVRNTQSMIDEIAK